MGCLGQPLTQWRQHLDRVVNTINHHHEKKFRSINQLLTDYFTRPTVVNLPQKQNHLYRYKINDQVVIDAPPHQRRALNFKYSLNVGKLTPPPFFSTINNSPAGKLQRQLRGIVKKRQLLTKNQIMFPVYTVFIPQMDQVLAAASIYLTIIQIQIFLGIYAERS